LISSTIAAQRVARPTCRVLEQNVADSAENLLRSAPYIIGPYPVAFEKPVETLSLHGCPLGHPSDVACRLLLQGDEILARRHVIPGELHRPAIARDLSGNRDDAITV